MRIRDWSSDVCSSDLFTEPLRHESPPCAAQRGALTFYAARAIASSTSRQLARNSLNGDAIDQQPAQALSERRAGERSGADTAASRDRESGSCDASLRVHAVRKMAIPDWRWPDCSATARDRKSTRLNSSH